jgi:hypothetical protein
MTEPSSLPPIRMQALLARLGRKTAANPGILVFLLVTLVGAPNVLGATLVPNAGAVWLLVSAIVGLMGVLATTALCWMALDKVHEAPITLDSVVSAGFRNYLAAWPVLAIMAVGQIVGAMLLVLPTILVLAALLLALPHSLMRHDSVLDALWHSARTGMRSAGVLLAFAGAAVLAQLAVGFSPALLPEAGNLATRFLPPVATAVAAMLNAYVIAIGGAAAYEEALGQSALAPGTTADVFD